jgi:hypothetical protein
MRIRNDQLAQLGRSRLEDFKRRLVSHLRKHHSEQVAKYSDGELRAYAEQCQIRAKRLYQIESEQGIACYAQLPFILGDGFETDPAWTTIPALLGRHSFEQNTRAKMALAFAYQLRALQKKNTRS